MMSITSLLLLALMAASSFGQTPIPNRPDGYGIGSPSAPVILDGFLDVLCPDSQAAWPIIKSVIAAYPNDLYFAFHTFPLPFHTNSFICNQGAHVINNASGVTAAYQYIDLLFAQQTTFYNAATYNMSMASVVSELAAIVAQNGLMKAADFANGIADDNLNWDTRVSWKYGCSRGITGTPSFLVNGVFVMADATWTLADWQSLIDPLLASSADPGLTHVVKNPFVSDNDTCPVGETYCQYTPTQYECCLPGEGCIKNVGCRCAKEGGCDAPKVEEPTAVIVNPFVSDNDTCPAGEFYCQYTPTQYECCLPGEGCIKNVGCRCAEEGGCDASAPAPAPASRAWPLAKKLAKSTKPVSNPFISANATCPPGETYCQYTPTKYECCLPGEGCIKNVGCRCAKDGSCAK